MKGLVPSFRGQALALTWLTLILTLARVSAKMAKPNPSLIRYSIIWASVSVFCAVFCILWAGVSIQKARGSAQRAGLSDQRSKVEHSDG